MPRPRSPPSTTGVGEVIQHADHDVRHARLARDFARLSPKDRARTLVLDPTREGRQALTDAIRAELVHDGTLGERATVTVLESVGFTDAARARAVLPTLAENDDVPGR